MNQTPPVADAEVMDRWAQMLAAYRAYREAEMEFDMLGDCIVPALKRALRGPDRLLALNQVARLQPLARAAFLEELVFLASWTHGQIFRARDFILSLPRDYVLAHIEAAAEPLLQADDVDYDTYLRLLELYELLDRDLTIRLMRRALAHPDPDIKVAGEDWATRLQVAPELVLTPSANGPALTK